MSPSERPDSFPLLPFCPLTAGNTDPFLLLFMEAAERETPGFRRHFVER